MPCKHENSHYDLWKWAIPCSLAPAPVTPASLVFSSFLTHLTEQLSALYLREAPCRLQWSLSLKTCFPLLCCQPQPPCSPWTLSSVSSTQGIHWAGPGFHLLAPGPRNSQGSELGQSQGSPHSVSHFTGFTALCC